MRTCGNGVYFVIAWIFLSVVNGRAQPMITKETKILLVMHPKTDDFTAMELFNSQVNIEELNKKYPDHRFYIGLLQGGYELHGNRIRPELDAVIIIYTDQQFYAGNLDFPVGNYPIGRSFKMQGNGIRVVSNKKGELILRIK